MVHYNNIMVAVDCSDEAAQVLNTAVDVAAMYEAKISVVHVAQRVAASYGQWMTYIPPVNDNKIKDQIYANLSQRVKNAGLNPDCIHIEFNAPVDAIIKRADKENCDLIMIGSHGRHGVQLLLGSTANGVLHHANCDVFAVRIQDITQ